ncbi:MAG: hypothetical protein B6I17_01845 [Tenericutes bacterium 4572_104]|nr:MAG: hypothetical protein B6I17_01845 [Tenericutes bacterium 4572_104]
MDLNNKFRKMIKKIQAYEYVFNLLGWDSSTEAPRESHARRAEIMGVLSKELFKLQTEKEYQDVVNELYSKLDTLDNLMQREIKKAKKELDKIINVPEEEYVEYTKLIQMSQLVWEDAKKNNDYDSFKDNLKQIIDFNKKFALYYNPNNDPYDTLLDSFEEGMTTKEYDAFFKQLKEELVPFVKKVLKYSMNEYDYYIIDYYDPKKQEEFCEYLVDVMKFNRDRGLMKKSVHPFTWNTSPQDVRFTTRYLERYVFSSIFATIHELGHATYEQQISTDFDDTLLHGGTSMGIHESQSRFYENIIGRSLEFWEANLDKFKEIFPEQSKWITPKDMYRAVNKVEASLIRIEADELTYSLHIMLRYEIERKLMSGEITVDDLPTIWNDLIEEYLGIRPKNDSEGVLQDVHWSGGMFGYFPTYALGSAYAAQFYYAMKKDLDIPKIVRNNELDKINKWLKEKIHQFGSSKSPKELLLEVTKEEFNPKYYIQYLKEKYTELYL